MFDTGMALGREAWAPRGNTQRCPPFCSQRRGHGAGEGGGGFLCSEGCEETQWKPQPSGPGWELSEVTGTRGACRTASLGETHELWAEAAFQVVAPSAALGLCGCGGS